MSEIAALTGQQRVLSEISRYLVTEMPARALLEGPPGCGKTWVLRQLSAHWSGLGRPVFTASGDRSASARALSPFNNALIPLKIDLQVGRVRKTAYSRIGGAVPMAGSLVSFLLEACLHTSERKQRSETPHLTPGEQEILFQLQHLAGNSELLIVADDLQYWDIDSLRLLQFMFSASLARTYSFLAKARLVVSRTRGTKTKHPEMVDEIALNFSAVWGLDYFEPESLKAIMQGFGFEAPLPEEQFRLIYAVCTGHLELIRRLTEYLVDGSESVGMATGFHTPGLDAYTLLHQLVSERLGQLGEEGTATKALICAAAVIGSSFSRLEIQCLLKWDAATLRKALDSAERLRLIESERQQLRFVHEDLRECLFRSLGSDAQEFHSALAICLSSLRPSDYFTRAEHFFLAGNEEVSAQLYFEGLLQRKREHLAISDELYRSVFSMLEALGFGAIASTVFEAQALFLTQQYGAAASLLEKTEHTFPPVFCAERDYLWALCLLKFFNSTESRRAKDLLANWDELRESEKDLWCRIQLTLLVAHVHLGESSQAMRIERIAARYLDSIKASDPGAEAAVNVLRRKSSALYGAEISRDRCREAAVYFGPLPGSGVPRNPAQYYMTLCNLAGNLIVTGEFAEAAKYAKQAVEMESEGWCHTLPRPEVAINNLVLSGFLAETLKASDAVTVYERLLAEQPAIADRHLILNNHAVVLTLTGRLNDALHLCSNVDSEMRELGKNDSYYQYFVRSNLAGLLHLSGRRLEAERLWQELETQVPEIAQEDRSYLVQRQRLQAGAFDEVAAGDAAGWQNYLLRRHPVMFGDGWRFYGRGFLMSDIQFWSES
jgi:Flp pilus assembly protein TadD